MLKRIQRFLIILLLVTGGSFLLYQAVLYGLARDKLAPGTIIAGVNVSEMTREEAAAVLNEHYLAPIGLHHQEERVALNPADVGFTIDVDAMLNEATAVQQGKPFWQGYLEFVADRQIEPVRIPLQAAHDREALRQQIASVAVYLDRPASPPQLSTGAGSAYVEGQPGYVTDVEASLPAAEMALYQPDRADREIDLVLTYQDPASFDLSLLQTQIQAEIDAADGLVGSVFVLDLATGDEMGINADAAISGLSILKIAIFVEAYRALDSPPNEYVQGLFYDTAVLSSNYAANLLLHEIAGVANTYEGAEILTESMHRLGLVNTFMAVPYDAAVVSTRPSTYSTPANSSSAALLQPDPARQTTAEDIGTLLAMIYHCANGGGGLLAAYPGEITPQECQAILDLMVLNEEGNLIRFGVPPDVPVSHKHGWDDFTHGDAGIVFSPGGDYVLVEYLHLPGNNFLLHDYSFPILRRIAQLTYNYFNFDDPYTEDVQARAEWEAAAREAAAEAAEEAADESDEDPGGDSGGESGGESAEETDAQSGEEDAVEDAGEEIINEN